MRVLISDLVHPSSGDTALAIATTRRLTAMGAKVTWFVRRPPVKRRRRLRDLRAPLPRLMDADFRRAGLEFARVPMPVKEGFAGVRSLEDVAQAFAHRSPDLHAQMQRTISAHDVVAIGPGGRFTDGFKNERNVLAAAVALEMGHPVIVLHQSVGPVTDVSHRSLLTQLFQRCELVLVREDMSFGFVRELGAPQDRTVRCRDPVFAETYPGASEPEFDLGVNLRWGPAGHLSLDALSELILGYRNVRPDARVLVYSTTFHLPDEFVAHLSTLPCEFTVRMPAFPDYVGEIGRARVNISDSFHGVIFSFMANRPVVCCQTDLGTWKLRGLHRPGAEPLEVLPGLVDREQARVVLDRVLEAEERYAPVVAQQAALAEYGREMANAGWDAVGHVLETSRKAPRDKNAGHRR